MKAFAPKISTSGFHNAVENIKRQSAALSTILDVKDLVLAQLLFMLNPTVLSISGRLGHKHLVYWFLALPLFFVPLVIVVKYLYSLMPYEGGPYQWAKICFGDFWGFIVGWNIWLYVILFVAQLALYTGSYLRYALNFTSAESSWFASSASPVIIVSLTLLAIRGLKVGKHINNVGGIIGLFAFIVIVISPFLSKFLGSSPKNSSFLIETPSFSLEEINLFAKMTFMSFAGFEYVGIFAGETKKPSTNIGRSIIIAAPIVLLTYILATYSLLAFKTPDEISSNAAIPQILSDFYNLFPYARVIFGILILALLGNYLIAAHINFNVSTRLPMVAGWDNLQLNWFTKLHHSYRTPINSIFFVGAVSLFIGLISLTPSSYQEAFQVLINASGLCYALTYLIMFLIPIFGLKNIDKSVSFKMKFLSIVGWLTTLLYIICASMSFGQVGNKFLYAIKIFGIVALTNLFGLLIFFWGLKRAQTPAL